MIKSLALSWIPWPLFAAIELYLVLVRHYDPFADGRFDEHEMPIYWGTAGLMIGIGVVATVRIVTARLRYSTEEAITRGVSIGLTAFIAHGFVSLCSMCVCLAI